MVWFGREPERAFGVKKTRSVFSQKGHSATAQAGSTCGAQTVESLQSHHVAIRGAIQNPRQSASGVFSRSAIAPPRKRSRSRRLLGCKRPRDGFGSLLDLLRSRERATARLKTRPRARLRNSEKSARRHTFGRCFRLCAYASTVMSNAPSAYPAGPEIKGGALSLGAGVQVK